MTDAATITSLLYGVVKTGYLYLYL